MVVDNCPAIDGLASACLWRLKPCPGQASWAAWLPMVSGSATGGESGTLGVLIVAGIRVGHALHYARQAWDSQGQRFQRLGIPVVWNLFRFAVILYDCLYLLHRPESPQDTVQAHRPGVLSQEPRWLVRTM